MKLYTKMRVNSSVIFTKMACDKNQAYLQPVAGSVSPGLDAPRVTGNFPNPHASLGEFGKLQAAQSLNSLYILNIYTEYLLVISIGNSMVSSAIWI
jgi:hypothetical protein